jgi:hypothetical protein
VFHARIGATVRVETVAKTYTGIVNGLTFHFKKGEAFSLTVKMEI